MKGMTYENEYAVSQKNTYHMHAISCNVQCMIKQKIPHIKGIIYPLVNKLTSIFVKSNTLNCSLCNQ